MTIVLFKIQNHWIKKTIPEELSVCSLNSLSLNERSGRQKEVLWENGKRREKKPNQQAAQAQHTQQSPHQQQTNTTTHQQTKTHPSSSSSSSSFCLRLLHCLFHPERKKTKREKQGS